MIHRSRLDKSPWSTVALFLLPSLIGFVIFILIPSIMTVGLSFTDYSGGYRMSFIGLENYIRALGSPEFHHSLGLTIGFTIWVVFFQVVLGIAFALMLDKKQWGRNAFRAIYFLPNVLSSVAVSLVFMLLLDSRQGPVNQMIRSLFGVAGPLWLAGEKTALPTIGMIVVWQNFGYYMVLFLGGLQSINSTLYEASAIDGAGKVRQFFSVTLPGLSPVLFFSITMAVIKAFQVFDQVFSMTGGQYGGGPAGATSVLVFDIYQKGFGQFRFGYAAAESTILLIIVLAITVVQQLGQKKWVVYDVV